jgi:hypothetical protein
MDEDVIAAIIWHDEAEAFVRPEHSYRPLCHCAASPRLPVNPVKADYIARQAEFILLIVVADTARFQRHYL